ncbi:MAG: hypothetical protein MI784_13955 [Cytophagales bacterium]|nr:hypothetical protein [Cytophagales bacterium]
MASIKRFSIWGILLVFIFLFQTCGNDDDEIKETPDWATEVAGVYLGELNITDLTSGGNQSLAGTLPFERMDKNLLEFNIEDEYVSRISITSSFTHNDVEILELNFADTVFTIQGSNGPLRIDVQGYPRALYGNIIDGAFNKSTKELEIQYILTDRSDTLVYNFKGTMQSSPTTAPARLNTISKPKNSFLKSP